MKWMIFVVLLLLTQPVLAKEALNPGDDLSQGVVSGNVRTGNTIGWQIDGLLPGFQYELRFVGNETIIFDTLSPTRINKVTKNYKIPSGTYTGEFQVFSPNAAGSILASTGEVTFTKK